MASRLHGARAFRLTKVGTVHASATDIENASSAALSGAPNGTTFVTSNSDQGIQHHVVTDDAPGREGVAFQVARAMSARSDEVDDVPDLISAGGFAKIVANDTATPMMDTQQGADFTALSRIIGDVLKPGEWVAISIRKPSLRWEVRPQTRWLDHHGLRTHHSRKTGAPVMAMYAGGTDVARARYLVSSVSSAIPGFGLPVRSRAVTETKTIVRYLTGAVVFGAASVASHLVPFDVPGAVTPVLAATAVAAIVAGVLTWRGILPSARSRLLAHLQWGRVPVAATRVRPPRRPREERQVNTKEGGSKTIQEFGGDYPLAQDAFLVGPHIPLALVAPHSSGAGASTGQRPAPAALREHVGPQIGVNMDLPVRLSIVDASSSWAAIGQANSGKTALLEHLWGTALSERVNPSGIPGAPKRHAMVAFDTKGDGLASVQYESWAKHVGDKRTIVVHALDPVESSRTRRVQRDGEEVTAPFAMGIDLFPYDPAKHTAADWARRVTNALRYIWGETSIGPESFDTLNRVLAAARVISPEMAARVSQRTIPRHASPFFYANILLTNEGDALGVELAATLSSAASDPASSTPELVDVVSQLSPLYGDGRTPAQRSQLVKAPRTKVAALMTAEHWWSHPLKRSWERLLQSDAAVVVNTGVGPSGHLPDDKLRTDMSGLMLYTLAEEIKRVCIGWYEENRAVSIYADEVKHLASTSAEVVNWMRHDARANGVRAVFATQTPETLVPEVRGTILGFGSLILFSQNDPAAVGQIVKDLQMSGGEWDTSDLANLDRYNAIVRTTVGSKRQEPFTVQIPDFRSQRDTGVWKP